MKISINKAYRDMELAKSDLIGHGVFDDLAVLWGILIGIAIFWMCVSMVILLGIKPAPVKNNSLSNPKKIYKMGDVIDEGWVVDEDRKYVNITDREYR